MGRIGVTFILVLAVVPSATAQQCLPSSRAVSIAELVERVERDTIRYVFVGERHASGPAKRFAVELVNALVDAGHDVGLYVEGFRTDCSPRDTSCATIARLFNADAFALLLDESRAPVRPLAPPERDGRAARMAATLASGSEAIRVVLVGNTHVIDADTPEAELWVFGGAVRYPDPGDLAKAFPREEILTLALQVTDEWEGGYSLLADGCRADYRLSVPTTGSY